MNSKTISFVTEKAREHAAIGKKMVDEVVAVAAPLPPKWDPVGNPDHNQIAEDMTTAPLVADLTAIEGEQRDAVAQTLGEPVWTIAGKTLLVGGVEVFAITRLFVNLGSTLLEAVTYALGIVICFLGALAFSRSAISSRLSRFAMVAFVTGACAIAVLRAHDAGAVGTVVESLAFGALAILMTVGPALYLEPILRRVRAAYVPLLRFRATRRQRQAAENRLASANAAHRDIHANYRNAVEDRKQLVAVYELEHARATADFVRTDPNRPTA